MRPLAIVFAIVALTTPALAQATAGDERAIRSVITNFAAIWNRQDLHAFGELFSDHADFVVITGKHLKGRDEIQKYHSELMKSAYAGSHLVWNPVDVRFLRPDDAVAHVSTEISFNEGKEKRRSFATLVLTKRQSRWRIEALQNTLISAPPVGQTSVPKK
jgi:uncharacterized protein (TIGR02246 family)